MESWKRRDSWPINSEGLKRLMQDTYKNRKNKAKLGWEKDKDNYKDDYIDKPTLQKYIELWTSPESVKKINDQ